MRRLLAWPVAVLVVASAGFLSAPAVRPSDEGSDRTPVVVTLALAGDTMLGRLVDGAIARHGPLHPWGDLLPDLRAADLTLVNLETTLTTSRRAVPKTFNYRANPRHVVSLVRAGVDVCNVANNHILDFGVEGLVETLVTLDEAGIGRVGAGRDLAEAREPLFVNCEGVTLAILGCTDNEDSWAAGEDRPGTFWADVRRPEALASWAREIDARADVLVLTVHWGPNMRVRPSRAHRAFAHRMIEAGVDVFHGHSAHVVQGIEIYRDRVILYDTGDFVDDYAVTPSLRNDLSFLFRVEVDRTGPRRLELVPVLIDGMQVNRARGDDREWISARIRQLSAEFGTSILDRGDRLEIAIERAAAPGRTQSIRPAP